MNEILPALWKDVSDPRVEAILPRDLKGIAEFHPRLIDLVTNTPRRQAGTIDPAAIVRGEIVSMAPGSVIEAGAVIHASCRLVLGERSVVRSGAILRDAVFIGDDCLVGSHCEVARCILIGPRTELGHHIFVGDSIVGARSLLSGFVAVANTHIRKGGEISIRVGTEKIPSERTHFGCLIGDGARIGASTMICPGTIVLPGLELPPSATLLGVVDRNERERLMKAFFERVESR